MIGDRPSHPTIRIYRQLCSGKHDAANPEEPRALVPLSRISFSQMDTFCSAWSVICIPQSIRVIFCLSDVAISKNHSKTNLHHSYFRTLAFGKSCAEAIAISTFRTDFVPALVSHFVESQVHLREYTFCRISGLLSCSFLAFFLSFQRALRSGST